MGQDDFVEIDIRELVTFLVKKWYLIIICFVLAAGAALAVTQFYLKPIYRAETTLFLGKEQDKIGGLSFMDLQVNSQLVIDYREILKSNLVAEQVHGKLGVNVETFKKNVNLETVKDSRIFRITYDDSNPKLTADVVNELADIIKQMASDIIEVKNVKVIDVAKVPERPMKPNKKLNTGLAGFVGLLLGVSLVYLLEFVDHTFKKPEELERQLELTVIGTVPVFEGGKRGKKKAKDQKDLEQEYMKNLIFINNPKAAASEAFRELRTNLQYTNIDKKVKSIVITSPSLGDGKTTTVCNLAISLAQSGNKVLVMDADFRKPKLHHYFGVKNNEGLTNILTDDKDFRQINIVGKTDVPGLFIVTSGPIPPNPAEMLSSTRMQQLLEQLNKEYDVILVDSPPVGQVTDAAILAGIVDGTILVIACGDTRIEMAKRAKKALKGVNAKIIGTVLTKFNTGRSSSYYYRYE